MTTVQTNKILREGPFAGAIEEVACPICAQPPVSRLIYRRDNGVGIWQCPACEVMYASPRFTEEALLTIYETPDFFPADDLKKFENFSHGQWQASGAETYVVSALKAANIKRYLTPGDRVLDVGCGIGLFVLEGRQQGFLTEGVEPSKMLTDIARNRIGIDVHNMLIEDFSPPHRFHGVGLWDVLEHVYDPVRILKRCFALTEEGGYIFVSVPNFAGLADRLQTLLHRLRLRRCGFKHFGFPWHVYSYNRRSLGMLLAKMGYTPLTFETWSHNVRTGKANHLSSLTDALIRKHCLASNVSCVARKI